MEVTPNLGHLMYEDVTATVNNDEASVDSPALTVRSVSYSFPRLGTPCRWCGKFHSDSFFDKIIVWFHSLLANIFRK